MAKKTLGRQTTIEELLGRYSPDVRRCALAVRKLVRSAAPKSHERVYPGWRVIAFGRDREMHMRGIFCGIGPLKGRVNVYFRQGALLPDPEGLLEGTGKGMRHVKIRAPGDIRSTAMKRLVREAYRLTAG